MKTSSSRVGALATDTLPEPNAPPWPIRWLTGNADPKGRLPWPFGETDYLVWWGTGSWPVWLALVPTLICLLFARPADARRLLRRRLDVRGVASSRPPGSVLATLLPAADPRHGDRRRGPDGGLGHGPGSRFSVRIGDHRPRTLNSRAAHRRGRLDARSARGDRRHRIPPGSRLPGRGPGPIDDPIQGRRPVGRPAGVGTRPRPPFNDREPPPSAGLGMAESLVLLLAAGLSHAPLLRQQPPARPGGPQPPPGPASDRRDHGDASPKSSRADLRRLRSVPGPPRIPERVVPPFTTRVSRRPHRHRTLDPQRRLRSFRDAQPRITPVPESPGPAACRSSGRAGARSGRAGRSPGRQRCPRGTGSGPP